MKPRVCHFIGSFHQGGSERQAVNLCRLQTRDATFKVFAATLNREGVLLEEAEAIGMPPIPEFKLTSFFDLNFLKQVRAGAAYLKENKIDIVHTHDFYTNVFGMAAARLAGVRGRIVSKRETGGMRSRAQDMVERIAFKLADAVVVNSAAVREHLAEAGVESTKLKLIYNGLDLERFAGASPRCSECRASRPKVVTLVANLRHEVKNVPMLLNSAKQVLEAGRSAKFVIAGEGPLESSLRSLADRLAITPHVDFLGRSTDVPAVLNDSDICVLTSEAEGFSNSILEYMAAGRPVVATDVGGAREAIEHGTNGYLVESKNDRELAARLIELIDDDERAHRFGAEGRRIAADRFSEKAQLNATLDLHRSLLS